MTERRRLAAEHRPAAARRRSRGLLRGRLRPRSPARARAARLGRRDQRAARGGPALFPPHRAGGHAVRRRSSWSSTAAASRWRRSGRTTPTSTAGGRAPCTSGPLETTPAGATSPSTHSSRIPLSGEVHDFVGGVADLRAGIIRAIGDAGRAHRRGPAPHAARRALRGPPRLPDRRRRRTPRSSPPPRRCPTSPPSASATRS